MTNHVSRWLPIALATACLTVASCSSSEPADDPVFADGQQGGADAPRAGEVSSQHLEDDSTDEQSSEEDNILVDAPDDWIPADAPSGGTLRRLQTQPVFSFNWLLENTVEVGALQTYLHDPVARRHPDDPQQWTPGLAHKVQVDDERTTYTIHLHEGVHWHSPNVDHLSGLELEWVDEPPEVTADDLAFWFEMALHPDVSADHYTPFVDDIDEVDVVDRYTLRVHWESPVYHARSTVLQASALPRWLYRRTPDGEQLDDDQIGAVFEDHWANRVPMGTGPYQFAGIEGDTLVMERDNDHWDLSPPIEALEWEVLPYAADRWEAVLTGELDYLPHLATEIYQRKFDAVDTDHLDYETIDRMAYYYIGWNDVDHHLFDDRRVRKAMTLALDREAIVEEVRGGLGTVQYGPYYHKHRANDPDIEPLPHDLERAAELLDEAGWERTDDEGIRVKDIDGERRRFEFQLSMYDQVEVWQWFWMYSGALADIGVAVEAVPLDWQQMQEVMENRDFDAFVGGWGLSPEVNLHQIWHSSQADSPTGSNRVGFDHSEADEIIETLRITHDEDERIELMRQFHRIVHHEQPYTFLYAPQDIAVWNAERLEDVEFQSHRPHDVSFPWIVGE